MREGRTGGVVRGVTLVGLAVDGNAGHVSVCRDIREEGEKVREDEGEGESVHFRECGEEARQEMDLRWCV